jgi:uncharacterized protein YjbI with pentapeptide repeats
VLGPRARSVLGAVGVLVAGGLLVLYSVSSGYWHSRSILALLGVLGVLSLLSLRLWASDKTDASRSNLGAALLGGLTVGITVLVVQLSIQERVDQRAERRQLQLLVSQQRDLTGIDLTDRNLAGFFLRERTLDLARFVSADLTRADLYGSKLRRTDLHEAKLTGAILAYTEIRDSNLQDADLEGASLVNATFVSVNVQGANLRNIDTRGADIRGLVYDDSTKWPTGLNPTEIPGGIDQCKRLRALGFPDPQEASDGQIKCS